MEEKDFEPAGLIPRSIIRTVERFRQQLRPETIALGIQEFRISRYQVRVSVRYFFILLLLPIAINWGAKNVIIKPLVGYFWNTYGTSLFLNSYQAERAFKEMRDFESQLFFEMLLSSPRSCPEANRNLKQDQQVLFNTGPSVCQASRPCNYLEKSNDQNPSFPTPSLMPASFKKEEILGVLPVPWLPTVQTRKLAYSSKQLASTRGKLLQGINGQCIGNFNQPCLDRISPSCQACIESKPQEKKYDADKNSEFSTTEQFVLVPLHISTKQEKLTQQNKQNWIGKTNSKLCFASNASQLGPNCTINKTKYKKLDRATDPAILNNEHLNITSSNQYNSAAKPCFSRPLLCLKDITQGQLGQGRAVPLLVREGHLKEHQEGYQAVRDGQQGQRKQQGQIRQQKAWTVATSTTLASLEIKTEPNSYDYPFTSAERNNHDFLDRINISNCFEVLFQEKTYLLAEIYNQQSITALSNMFGDCIMIISIILLLRLNAPQFTILKSFLIESFYSFNDAIKCFYIILITDFLVGFHSPRGWEIVMEMLLRHLGLPENEEFILLFVGTFPVFLDTAFKYWIFRYLNKISPSTVATYHSMIE